MTAVPLRRASLGLALSLALACNGRAETDAGLVVPDARFDLDAPAAADTSEREDTPGDSPLRADGGPLPSLPSLTVGTPDDPGRAAARFDCTPRAPTQGAVPVSFVVQLDVFGSGATAPDTMVDAFWDGVFEASCGARCASGTTNASGRVTLMAPANSWMAVHVPALVGATPATSWADTRAIHVAAPISAVALGHAPVVSVATLDAIPTAYGFTPTAGSLVVVGRLRDCGDDPVRGALVRIFDADGVELANDPSTNDAPHVRYYDGERVPDGDQAFTHVDGLFLAANLPTSGAETMLRVEAWGVVVTGEAPRRIACESISLTAGGVGVVPLGPYRADYDDEDPCAP